jgi:hypothetical protein
VFPYFCYFCTPSSPLRIKYHPANISNYQTSISVCVTISTRVEGNGYTDGMRSLTEEKWYQGWTTGLFLWFQWSDFTQLLKLYYITTTTTTNTAAATAWTTIRHETCPLLLLSPFSPSPMIVASDV